MHTLVLQVKKQASLLLIHRIKTFEADDEEVREASQVQAPARRRVISGTQVNGGGPPSPPLPPPSPLPEPPGNQYRCSYW